MRVSEDLLHTKKFPSSYGNSFQLPTAVDMHVFDDPGILKIGFCQFQLLYETLFSLDVETDASYIHPLHNLPNLLFIMVHALSLIHI